MTEMPPIWKRAVALSWRDLFLFVAAAALLLAARALFGTLNLLGYLYRGSVFDNFGLFLLLLFVLLIVPVVFVAGFAIARFVQGRFLPGLLLLAACTTPYFFVLSFDGPYWKFKLHEQEYLAAVKNDPSPPPKFKAFDWGNYNTSLGGGVVVEAVVYDETGEIALADNRRSAEWKSRNTFSRGTRLWWITQPPKCRRVVTALEGYFYYVFEECPG